MKQQEKKKQINDLLEEQKPVARRRPRGFGHGYCKEYSSLVPVLDLNDDKTDIVQVDTKDVQVEIDRYSQGIDVASIVTRYAKGDLTALNPDGRVAINSKCDDGYFDASDFNNLSSVATLIDRQKQITKQLEEFYKKQQEVPLNAKTSSPAVNPVQETSPKSEETSK